METWAATPSKFIHIFNWIEKLGLKMKITLKAFILEPLENLEKKHTCFQIRHYWKLLNMNISIPIEFRHLKNLEIINILDPHEKF